MRGFLAQVLILLAIVIIGVAVFTVIAVTAHR